MFLRHSLLAFACACVSGCAGAGMPGNLLDFSMEQIDPDADLSQPHVDLAGKDLTMIPVDMAGAGSNCTPANKALGAAGGPDVCNYGQYCDASSSKCMPVMEGSCAMVGGGPIWDKAAKQAPVIATISATLLATTDAATECTNGDPAALVTVEYYAPNNLTAQTTAVGFEPQVQWKKSVTSGMTLWYQGTFMRAMPAANAKYGSFKVGINCGGAALSVKTAGFYIIDGGGRTSNLTCVTWL